jgi:hypothetical protein
MKVVDMDSMYRHLAEAAKVAAELGMDEYEFGQEAQNALTEASDER